MNILFNFINTIITRINILSGRAAKVLSRARTSPLADRLLADALRLAEIPSPTYQEEQRAAFVLERLATLKISPQMDDLGNILVRIPAHTPVDHSALLLFSDMGSNRWHPLDSLTRLDSRYARGAGLADILGCATLLSIAEALTEERLPSEREVLILFAARSLDDPEGKAFFSIFENPSHFPCAAIGIRGLNLGSVITNTQGIYRIRVTMGREQNEKEAARDDMEGPDTPPAKPETANMVVDTLISTARKLSGITWDSKGTTYFYIRRIEAGTGFGRAPQEGILEIELESSNGPQLEMAMNTVKATAENAAKFSVENPNPDSAIKTEVSITSFIPVGEQNNDPELLKTIRGVMKDLHIRLREENGADPSAILSNRGIPSFSIGIAQGWEGLNSDTIEIASIEKGRQLIEALITRMSRTGGPYE
ncbi:MAG: hypothetical protein LBB68_00310 [Treponema sp.]|nr:hypothetical protein [Treponema sp.]